MHEFRLDRKPAANTVRYYDKSVSGGATYRYRVAASSSSGQPPYSNIVEATTS